MNAWRNKLWYYREKFKRLDRKWHVLIGAQLIFVVGGFRYNREQKRFEQQQQNQQYTIFKSSASNSGSTEEWRTYEWTN